MEQYLRRNRLATLADGLGALALIYGAALAWFVWLWGLGMPSLLAGAALGTLLAMARACWRRRRVIVREQALRSRLGAELLLEELLLSEAREAHERTAGLLCERWPLTVEQVTDDGVLCWQGAERLLVICQRMPPEGSLGAGDLAAAQRAVRRQGADRAILCALGKTPPSVIARAEQAAVPLRIVSRDTLLALAARHPATDAQLIALGQRRRVRPPGGVIALVLRRDKARRYFTYGLTMTLLYLLLGVRVYAVAGLTCLTLAVLCRTGRSEAELL